MGLLDFDGGRRSVRGYDQRSTALSGRGILEADVVVSRRGEDDFGGGSALFDDVAW